MDEEELVMQFTEERSLITLGWVCLHLAGGSRRGTYQVVMLDTHTSDAVLWVFH
jgi:hypothetical protein